MKADATILANDNVKISVVNTTLLKFAWPGSPAADQARWDRRMEDLQRALRCAQIMGADKLLLFAGTRVVDPPSVFQRIADTLAETAAEAEKQKITLLLENDAATNVATCEDLAAIMKLVPSKWVGISWRPAPDGYSLLPKKRILNVRVPAASLWPNRPESMNWRSVLTALDKDGYGGRVTLESGASGAKGVDATRDALDQLVHIVREVS
jgi:sugar phosphate isomerase/epimerase